MLNLLRWSILLTLPQIREGREKPTEQWCRLGSLRCDLVLSRSCRFHNRFPLHRFCRQRNESHQSSHPSHVADNTSRRELGKLKVRVCREKGKLRKIIPIIHFKIEWNAEMMKFYLDVSRKLTFMHAGRVYIYIYINR